ncbi:hypothetical protein [Ignicoccus islandicus]|uniref:hypothetical protein n=1 Tax=Ignicoccus islandicus TaxID=54259 RepID=UPI0012EE4B18|nr:hypothetical protein [Ignicoccus islandicus]
MLSKLLRLYVYLRVGISNYLGLFISIFNTSNLIWFLTPLHNYVSLGHFVAVFVAIYLPVATLLGYYDFKRGVTKTSIELSPYWNRATLIERKLLTGAMHIHVSPLKLFKESGFDNELIECMKRSYIELLKWITSDGRYIPKNTCYCDYLFKKKVIDEERWKRCVEIATEE